MKLETLECAGAQEIICCDSVVRDYADMTATWPVKRLDDLCEVTSSKRIYAKELCSSGVPFYRSKEIIAKLNGDDFPSSTLYISEERFQEILRLSGAPVEGDILLTSRGTLGVPYAVRGSDRFHFADGNLTWFRNFQDLDSHYLKYFFVSSTGKAELSKCVIGSSQAAYTIASLKKVEIPLPPLPVQRRIAGILSAYEELIENSQRRIRILEEMARSLYREWFVHFRFPGHENHPLVPSSLGDIPQGWEVGALGDLVQFKSGFAFKSGTFTADGEYRLVTIRNVQDGVFNTESDSRMNELPRNLPPYCVLREGDILLSLTGNVGRVCLVYDGPFLLNQRVSKLVPVVDFDWAMTYCMFRDSEMRIKLELLSNGVAQQNLSPVLASKMEFACPPLALRHQFSTLAEPIELAIFSWTG
jgi:type I restriction enzyme, S subunit